MTLDPHALAHQAAARDFDWARKQAALQQLMARLTGKSAELLPYNEVSDRLKPIATIEHGLQEVPLDKIVGSVGRYQDFTRSFFPKSDSHEERWTRVSQAVHEMRGIPPIEVYQVGEVYFVKDGNHRVSVARQLGSPSITAHVTEVKTRVPLTAEDNLAEVIAKSHYADFLEKTNLDKLYSQANLYLTFTDQYEELLAQIEQHQQKIKRPFAEAVSDWYQTVYLPVIEIMREQGVLRRFPDYTEADLYILVSEHHTELQEALGWTAGMETIVPDLGGKRWTERLRDILPPNLNEGPDPGEWRHKRLAGRPAAPLFSDILLGVRGRESDWPVIEVALQIAKWENGRLHGLHVLTHEQKNNPAVRHLEKTFLQKCQTAEVPADFTTTAGAIADTLLQRARWADLLVVNLAHPPALKGISRLNHGLYQLIQRCPHPILTVPGQFFPLDRALLAYDGSPKADEALFVAAYLAVQWHMTLTVVTVVTPYTQAMAVEWARDYLQPHEIEATYVVREKNIGEAILETAELYQCDLLIMGGFGYRPVQHLVLGSTVDQMLREFHKPILICR